MSVSRCHSIQLVLIYSVLLNVCKIFIILIYFSVLSHFNFISLVFVLMYVAGYFSADVNCVTFLLNKELVDFFCEVCRELRLFTKTKRFQFRLIFLL